MQNIQYTILPGIKSFGRIAKILWRGSMPKPLAVYGTKSLAFLALKESCTLTNIMDRKR